MGCLGNILWFIFGGAISGLSKIRWWCRFFAFEYYLVDCIRASVGVGACSFWLRIVYYNYRNSFW